MEKPKCRICGERHYGMCPQPEAPKRETPVQRAARRAAHVEKVMAHLSEAVPENPAPQGAVCPTCKQPIRKIYMREYMRKRRAQKKG